MKNLIDIFKSEKKTIGLNQSLKLIGLNHSQFYQWQLETRFDCFDSYLELCVKNYPCQLSVKEIQKIKSILTDSLNQHWPVISLASKALRDKKVVASHFSWYKYAKLLGITRKVTKKNKKKVGIISTYVNEYWHCDLTYYPLANGKNVYITFVMDNFSKMILGWCVRKDRSHVAVKTALKMAIEHLITKGNAHETLLVTDGGKENVNSKVYDFLKKLSGFKIKRITALKDIQFSNSPVEAIHRTLKGRYLPKNKFYKAEEVIKHLEWSVKDYNEVRPHYKHKPRTPFEVYYDIPLDFDLKERMAESRKKRLAENLSGKCFQCKCKKTGKCFKPKDEYFEI